MAVGDGAAQQRDQVGFPFPIHLARTGRCPLLPMEGCLDATFDKRAADADDRREAHAKCRADRSVGPCGASRTGIGLEQDPGMRDGAGRGPSRTGERHQRRSFVVGQGDVMLGLHTGRLGRDDRFKFHTRQHTPCCQACHIERDGLLVGHAANRWS
jgi:hypothetical protein